MASNKPLPPSQRKLKKARQDGDVAKSRDLTTSVMLSACFAYVFALGQFRSKLESLFISVSSSLADFHSNNMLVYAVEARQVLFELLAPFFVLLFVSAFVAEVLQVGFCVSFKSLKPDGKRLSFLRGLRRILGISSEGQEGSMVSGLLYEIGKMAFVVFIVLGVLLISAYELVPRLAVLDLKMLGSSGFRSQIFYRPVIYPSLVTLFVIGVVDYLTQRRRRFLRLRMDITEFRKEMRESEGDPELKGMRKQLFQETIFGSSLNAMRKAKVLVLGRRKVD